MSVARILIVEDEAITAAYLADVLESLGHTVVGTAKTGAEALAREEEQRPELVLMDLQLKGELDGVAAARAIRARRDVPVVFVTAHADPETVARVAAITPAGYVVKPAREEHVRSAVELALTRHRAEARVREARERERYEAVRNLSALVAHEVGSPAAADASSRGFARAELAALRAALARAPGPGATEDLLARLLEVEHALEDAESGDARVRGVLHDLRSFARPLGETEPLDVRALVETVVRAYPAPDGIHLAAEVSGAPRAQGGGEPLRQALALLIGALVEGMPAGGADRTVRVAAAEDPQGIRIALSAAADPARATSGVVRRALGEEIVRAMGGTVSAEERPTGAVVLVIHLRAS